MAVSVYVGAVVGVGDRRAVGVGEGRGVGGAVGLVGLAVVGTAKVGTTLSATVEGLAVGLPTCEATGLLVGVGGVGRMVVGNSGLCVGKTGFALIGKPVKEEAVGITNVGVSGIIVGTP